jgi:outer membrane murein-binding lipoprotein Lpp
VVDIVAVVVVAVVDGSSVLVAGAVDVHKLEALASQNS